MNTLDLVKAAKSATGDFANFWKNLVDFFRGVPALFETFGKWDDDRVANIGLKTADKTGYVENTRKVFTK